MITLLAKMLIREDGKTDEQIRRQYGTLCSIFGIFLNACLFAGKYFAGFVSGSIAIMADAFNNLSDAASSCITLIGFLFAGKKPDLDHPFGHGRVEYLSGLGVSFLIILMGFELAKESVVKIMNPEKIEAGIIPLIILLISVLVKVYMGFYNRNIGKRIHSAAMLATATDSLSDSVATLAVLAAMLISHFLHVNVDGVCGLLVSLLIMIAGVQSAKDTISPLLGQAPDPDFVKRIKEIVMAHEDIKGIHDLIVHDYGPGRVLISLHAEVSGDGDIYELHDLIDCIERELEEQLHCETTIHMDPIDTNNGQVASRRADVEALIHALDEKLSIHDFRMVVGVTHTNLIFDVVVPSGYKKPDEELKKEIQERIWKKWPDCFVVIRVDRSYIG